MKIDQLIDDALLLLGENPAFCLSFGEDGLPGGSLRERLMMEAEGCAARAVADTPRELLTGWSRLPTEGLKVESDGKGVLRLPDDFLMLHSLRLSGWERGVTEILAASHWLRRWQGSRWHGLRGNPQRPLAFHALDADGRHCLELFSAYAGDSLEEGWYMALPRIKEDGGIEIPPAAYRKCLDYMVDTLRMYATTR